MADTTKTFTYDDYTVAIICPLEVEMTAVRCLLDEEHKRLPLKDGDRNRYILGKMGKHRVAIAFLPRGSQGIGAAAIVATDMRRTFPSAQLRLLVGIGGGIPSKKNDIRLGDVVVGMPDGIHGGVVQYDLGKRTVDGFERKGFLQAPPDEWRTAVVDMMSEHKFKPNQIDDFLSKMLEKYPKLQEYSRPAPDLDVLFPPDTIHVRDEQTCDRCDKSNAISRRGSTGPRIFYGTIASGDSVVKDATVRDELSETSGGALCFEMEAAGLSDGKFPCVVVRGICDYADSHKNEQWHSYAAGAAAACAKELLTYMDPIPVTKSNPTQMKADLSELPQAVPKIYGREGQLGQIMSYFDDDRIHRPRILILWAMGGQGKTQIAIEYCHRARDKYRGVFWLNSSSKSILTQSMVGVARKLNVASTSGDDADIDSALRTLGDLDDRWLMVFDNLDDPALFIDIRRFFPRVGRGDILLTSRHRGLGELGNVIDIPRMPDVAGVELLLRRYHGIKVDDFMSEGFEIVDRLGGLALAIDQASAYMDYKKSPIDDLSKFLGRYEDQRKKVLQQTTEDFWAYTKITAENGREQAVGAFTTWEMSFEQLVKSGDSPDRVKHFLTLAAFLGPTPVGESMFAFHASLSKVFSTEDPPDWPEIFKPVGDCDEEDDPDSRENDILGLDGILRPFKYRDKVYTVDLRHLWSSDLFWRLIRKAHQMSLLQDISRRALLNGATFRFHPLIRDWLQLRLGTKDRQIYTQEAIDVILSSIRMVNRMKRDLAFTRSILLHMDAILLTIDSFFEEGHRLGEVLEDITNPERVLTFTWFYRRERQSVSSLELLHRLAITSTRELGPEHPFTLDTMDTIAFYQHTLGQNIKAVETYRKVVDAKERLLGKEDGSTLRSSYNLAMALTFLKIDEAATVLRRVLEAQERVLGKEHPDTLESMLNLAMALDRQGNLAEPETMIRKVLEVQESAQGKEHPDLLMTRCDLASVLAKQGRIVEAERMLRAIMEGRERVLGKEHPDVLTDECHLAMVLAGQGKLVEAEGMLRAIMEVQERVQGREHMDTILTKRGLAATLERDRRPLEAEKCYMEVVVTTTRNRHQDEEKCVAHLLRFWKRRGVEKDKINQLLESTGTVWRISPLDGTMHNTAAANQTPELEEVQATEAPGRQTSHGSEPSVPSEERGRNVRMNFVKRSLRSWAQRIKHSGTKLTKIWKPPNEKA